MEKELSDLNQTLMEIYTKNLSLLKDKFPSIYNRIEKISSDIENKIYNEKYTLEYTNGYFDILNNHADGGWYYGKNSFTDADERAKVSNFTTESSLELLRKDPYSGKFLNGSLYKDVAPIVDRLNKIVNFEKIEYTKIFKHIYIGTGLGLHIQEIDKVLNSLQTLIIEDELEIFRLSLFITDYTIFDEGNRKLLLFVGENKNDLRYCLDNFSNYQKYMNFNIKYTTLLESSHEYKDIIISYFSSNHIGYFPYKMILQNLKRTVNFMANKEKFLDANIMLEKALLKDKNVLMISAGPSLDGYIEWIKENQNKFIIISVDVIISKLEENNIIPDIVVSIDPSPRCADYITTKDPHYLDNSSFIFLSQQDSKVIEVVKGKKYYFSQVLPIIEEIGYMGSTTNVGSYSLELALYLGAKEIYTIGNDAAFHQESGTRYASGAGYSVQDDIKLNENKSNDIALTDTVEVEGNFTEKVKTNRDLIKFKYDFEHALVKFEQSKVDLNCYNLSSGAKLEGYQPLIREDFIMKSIKFKTINKSIFYHELGTVVKSIDNLNYDEDIKIINSILTKIKKFQKFKISSKDDFLKNKLDLMIWILSRIKQDHISLLGALFLEYTSLVDIYINFYMNLKDKEIHSKSELKNISDLWAQGTIVLFKEIKDIYKQVK